MGDGIESLLYVKKYNTNFISLFQRYKPVVYNRDEGAGRGSMVHKAPLAIRYGIGFCDAI